MADFPHPPHRASGRGPEGVPEGFWRGPEGFRGGPEGAGGSSLWGGFAGGGFTSSMILLNTLKLALHSCQGTLWGINEAASLVMPAWQIVKTGSESPSLRVNLCGDQIQNFQSLEI